MKKPRGVLIAGNWKMNLGPQETEAFLFDLEKQEKQHYDSLESSFKQGTLKACLIPPSVSLERAALKASQLSFPLCIGAQNAHWEKKGAFTGELSGPMLQELGIQCVLVGHSERRQFFGETDQTVRLRAESLLKQGLQIILCIGETRQEREEGKTLEILTRQLEETLFHSSQSLLSYLNGTLVLAYEPVWAIGTGLTATPEQAEEVHQQIRKLIQDRLDTKAAAQTPILYGGSVTPENIDFLLACPNVDGALVGGASLKPQSFCALLLSGARALAS